ncbi:MAG: hypothetical protein AB8B53_02725 [Flavobacteriales bacterium]
MNKKLNHVFFVYLNVRLGAFIAAFYYFVITVGISLSLHFCKGELSYLSLVPGNESFCCHSTGHEDTQSAEHTVCPENCCSTETVTIALDTDFAIKSLEQSQTAVLIDFKAPQNKVEGFTSSSLPELNITRGPPLSTELYLLHSQFIFYG